MSAKNLTRLVKYAGGFILCSVIAVASVSAAPCPRTAHQQDLWLLTRVDALVSAARMAYENDDRRERYEGVVESISGTLDRCRLTDDRDFVRRYPEFNEYLRLLSLALKDDHQLGFEVTDKQYFAETSQYTAIPDFLLTPQFLRAVSRAENLPQARALLREMNASRTPDEKLIFFSYTSRHLGTPDNPDSYRRLLIIVPGNRAQQVPEKWVQFGIADPRKPKSVRNISVVAVLRATEQTTNVYFKDFYRTYRRNGSVTIKGRWELGEDDDNCVSCHKSGVLPIFPEAGSVSRDEQPLVETVNERFRSYGPARFGGYLDPSKFGPGLGSLRDDDSELFRRASFGGAKDTFKTVTCASCHRPNRLGSLNWPMDKTLISSFVKGGQMPLNSELRTAERARLYNQLVQDYFSVDNVRPGILKAWLLGKMR